MPFQGFISIIIQALNISIGKSNEVISGIPTSVVQEQVIPDDGTELTEHGNGLIPLPVILGMESYRMVQEGIYVMER